MIRPVALLLIFRLFPGLGNGEEPTWNDGAVFRGVNPAVQQKIVALRKKMDGIGRRVYLMSGARKGRPARRNLKGHLRPTPS